MPLKSCSKVITELLLAKNNCNILWRTQELDVFAMLSISKISLILPRQHNVLDTIAPAAFDVIVPAYVFQLLWFKEIYLIKKCPRIVV